MITRAQREQTRGPAGDTEDGTVCPRVVRHVLNEELFRGALTRERKRSDRSNEPFVLLLLGFNPGLGADSSSIWDGAIDAVAAATGDADVAGWVERRSLIGVIVPEIRASDLLNARAGIEARLRREIAKRLDTATVERLSLRLHIYPEPRRAEEKGPGPVDPVFYPEHRSRRVQGMSYDTIKRGLDVIGSLTLLLGLSPLFVLIAGLVKLGSHGPVVFRQVRIGQMMKPFTMLKFRTMYSDADHKVHQEFVSSFIRASGQADQPSRNGFFKLTNDSRVTPVGRILRKTSLDELPQLWNVLRGEMSLVGPRPPLRYELEQYEPWHRDRLVEAMPGITGLWQVAGRSRTTFDEMVRLDLRYARTRSFWTDVKILLATPAAVLSGKGAC
jgi:lipopolysaccharide/colanic/teichoic acid biosynthesis glycosyltransferase